jgi:hypothetical protein
MTKLGHGVVLLIDFEFSRIIANLRCQLSLASHGQGETKFLALTAQQHSASCAPELRHQASDRMLRAYYR